MSKTYDGQDRPYWRLWSTRGSGSSRPYHKSLDCPEATSDEENYKRVTESEAENARPCSACFGPYVCARCETEHDTYSERKSCEASHGAENRGMTAYDLADTDVGPEDVGLAPMGEREVSE